MRHDSLLEYKIGTNWTPSPAAPPDNLRAWEWDTHYHHHAPPPPPTPTRPIQPPPLHAEERAYASRMVTFFFVFCSTLVMLVWFSAVFTLTSSSMILLFVGTVGMAIC